MRRFIPACREAIALPSLRWLGWAIATMCDRSKDHYMRQAPEKTVGF
ncbi:MAG: hypothetical protein H7Z11_09445 [Verrucomicrobia bacterium]|nr:hypothetical protein [Leptolyngbya sp. ES-bin-22]